MRSVILGLILLLSVGCGGGSSNTNEPTTQSEQNGPKSPTLNDKEKVPPSIPNI